MCVAHVFLFGFLLCLFVLCWGCTRAISVLSSNTNDTHLYAGSRNKLILKEVQLSSSIPSSCDS